jgi:hypothetical protein
MFGKSLFSSSAGAGAASSVATGAISLLASIASFSVANAPVVKNIAENISISRTFFIGIHPFGVYSLS